MTFFFSNSSYTSTSENPLDKLKLNGHFRSWVVAILQKWDTSGNLGRPRSRCG